MGLEGYIIAVATMTSIYILLTLGLNLQWGFTGLINFGHVGFFAVGAYTSALLTLNGAPFVIGLGAAIIMAGSVAYLIGIPSLRLKGLYLAMATYGFTHMIHLIFENSSWSGGTKGLPGIPRPLFSLFRENYGAFYLSLLLASVIITYVLLKKVVNSPFGRVLKAIREDEEVAMSIGKNVPRFKMQSLVLGSAVAGAAGSLYAHYITFIVADQFIPIVTYYIWLAMVMGGSGNNKGSILGGCVLFGFLESTRFLTDYIHFVSAEQLGAVRLIVVGLLLVITMMLRPEGILKEEKKAFVAGEEELVATRS